MKFLIILKNFHGVKLYQKTFYKVAVESDCKEYSQKLCFQHSHIISALRPIDRLNIVLLHELFGGLKGLGICWAEGKD